MPLARPLLVRAAPLARAAALALTGLLTLAACDDGKQGPPAPPPSRFDSVKRAQGTKAASSFCEATWPAGETAKRFAAPATKALPAPATNKNPGKGWRWVNLWATWCHPCIEEIGLLGRWQASLQKDGVPLDLELYSVDDDAAALQGWLQKTKMPGEVKWLAGGANDLPAVLASLGVDQGAGIPVHALVDPSGALRCVRTGSVHDEDYGAVKAIVTGG